MPILPHITYKPVGKIELSANGVINKIIAMAQEMVEFNRQSIPITLCDDASQEFIIIL